MKNFQNSFCKFTSTEGGDFTAFVRSVLPEGTYVRILVKPNWVKHEESEAFPIEALVTNAALIDAILEACTEAYPECEEIIVGDSPLQSCDFDKMNNQSGVAGLVRKYENRTSPNVRFLDLRRERYSTVGGFLDRDTAFKDGDPYGYSEVVLDEGSFLEPISDDRDRFRVSDYDPKVTTSSHCKGDHRYLVAASVLHADLVINVPKLKTHQKAGLTGALKNMVGINGQKAFLVHHRKGTVRQGGDEFPPDVTWPVLAQTRLREFLQKRSGWLFRTARTGWKTLKGLYGIKTEGTRENLGKNFYVAAGSWYGNDTVWRMIYDLNRIIRYGDVQTGRLADSPQRDYLCIMDAGVTGEGNGPLQPLPVKLNLLGAGNDPFLMDMAAARIMGMDYRKIPCLINARKFDDPQWANFDPETVGVELEGESYEGLSALPIKHRFIPPPGWVGHIEWTDSTV